MQNLHRPARVATASRPFMRVLLALALLAVSQTPAAAQSIPDRLADSTYWRMITEFSEPSGYFASENFVSNETNWQRIIPPMLGSTRSGGVYLGVGPEQNFTYLVAFKPKIAFIVDIRRQNLLQHMWYKAVIELSNDRADFLSRLFGRPRPAGLDTNSTADALISAFEASLPDSALFRKTYDAVRDVLLNKHGFKLSAEDMATLYHVDSAFFFAGPSLNYSFNQNRGGFGGRSMPTFANLMREDDGTGLNRSFIGSEANYRVLRDLQQRNLLVPVVGDFAGDKALNAVGAWIKARGATVSHFYVSNVEQYLFQGSTEWSRFYTTVGKLPLDSMSAFIRSVTFNRGRCPVPSTAATATGMMAQLTSSLQDIVKAFNEGKILQYCDVISLSK